MIITVQIVASLLKWWDKEQDAQTVSQPDRHIHRDRLFDWHL